MENEKSFFQRHKSQIIGYPIAIVVCVALFFLAKYFGKAKTVKLEDIPIYRLENPDDMPATMTISNDKLKLELDTKTTKFTLTDKFGNTWTSNPPLSDSKHPESESLIMITYMDSRGTRNEFNSYTDSVQRSNYCIREGEDGQSLFLDYTIGKVERLYKIPQAITEAQFNDLISRLENSGAENDAIVDAKSNLKAIMKKLVKGKIKDQDKKYFETYKKLEEQIENGETVYVLRSDTQAWKIAIVEEYLADLAGYTQEEYETHINQFGGEIVSNQIFVNVTLELRLDGEDLVARVDYDKIQYFKDYPLVEVRILPFMIASAPDNGDTGFLFVPDGTGAIINFNNNKSQQNYSAKIYGHDYAKVQDVLINDPYVSYPVYGISYTNQNKSMLAMIEDGACYGVIRANTSGGNDVDANYVNTLFNVVQYERADIGTRSNAAVYTFEESIAKNEGLSIRFRAVNSSDYVDMAKCYRDYYIAANPDFANRTASTSVPAVVELVGAITKKEHVLGFPKDKPFAVTTYDEMSDIVEELNSLGMNNMNVILNGWFNDGVKHEVPNKIKAISELGGKKDFKNALDTIQKNNNLYLKANFTFVNENKLFDSFNYRNDTAKYVTREFVKKQQISKVWYGLIEDSDYFYLGTPEFIMETYHSFLDELKDYNAKNIAFTYIGNTLSADYNRKKEVTRNTVLNQHIDELSKLSESGAKIVTYDSNAYAVPYTDLVVNMAVDSDSFCLLDEAIPFFPILLHGRVDYTGDAMNVTADFENNLLKSVENGAGVYFIFMMRDAMELQETDFTYLYGANYDAWKEDAIKYYKRFSEDFGSLCTETIDNHEIIDTKVTMTEYSDGTQVYVNFRTADYTLEDGTVIPKMDWIVKKGGN